MTLGLAVEALSFGYHGRAIGRDVSFAIAPGEALCLLGANGGGKSTLFKTILGLLRPIAGRVLMDGEDLAGWDAPRRARAIGYAPQSGAGLFAYTVQEMVLMGRIARRGVFAAPNAADRAAAEAAMESLGISALAQRDWLRISGGERQLALIARALAQEPRLLALDEPTASLDFGNQLRVLERVRRLADGGLAVLFSTHHPEQAFAWADRVALLHEGRLERLGAPEAVITSETMRLAYGVEVDVVSAGPGVKVCAPRGFGARAACDERAS